MHPWSASVRNVLTVHGTNICVGAVEFATARHFAEMSAASHCHSLSAVIKRKAAKALLTRHLLSCTISGMHAQQFDAEHKNSIFYVCMQVRELRERTDCLPDDYWVVLTGDLITEEALPTYMAMLNTLDGVRDETVRVSVECVVQQTLQLLPVF